MKLTVKRTFLKGLALACSALAVTFILGCTALDQDQAEDSTAETVLATFVDSTGAEVVVTSADRVVACMGSFANIWELAGGTLVGASDDAFTSYDILSEDVEMVGNFSSLNAEAIIALEPDFVIMTSGTGGYGSDSTQVELAETLVASGITVAYFEVTTFDDYLEMLEICCEITGRDDLYQENGLDVLDAINEIIASVPEDADASALLMITYSGGTTVQASTTMAGDMLADLGVTNLADEYPSLLSEFSLESIIEIDPDFIFIIPMGYDTESAMESLTEATEANPAWSTLSAVEDGRYLTLDSSLFLYKPNNNWAASYQALYDALYL